MQNLKLTFIFIVFIISGCASNYGITYNSEPQGAAVICNGVNKGYTPTTLYYELQRHNKESGTINPVPCYAQWSSGVSEQYSRSFSITKFPDGVMQTLQRPSGAGYQQDVEFALKVRQMKAAESTAYQQQRAAEAAERQNFNYQQQNNSNKNCYRMMDGSYLCY